MKDEQKKQSHHTSITPEEIKRIASEDDDFGHEMRVGHALNPNNVVLGRQTFVKGHLMQPIHGETYEDPKTQKSRQFDYRSKIVHGQYQNRVISLAIECKNLNPELPLVICGRARTQREAYHSVILHAGTPKALGVTGASSLYEPNDFVGKSILRIKIKEKKLCSDGDSEIYDRWSQALASSHELAVEASRHPSTNNQLTFIMPMVVVPNGSLWIANYSESGKIVENPKPVKHCEFNVAHKMDIGFQFSISHIHFLTIEGLKELLSDFADGDCYKWDKIFSITRAELAPP